MVIDTDILIDHFHGNAAATTFIEQALLAGQTLFISVATVAEILARLRPGEEQDTEALLSLFTFYPADEMLAHAAGAYLNQFGASHKLDLGDALTAATARLTKSALCTRNVRALPHARYCCPRSIRAWAIIPFTVWFWPHRAPLAN